MIFLKDIHPNVSVASGSGQSGSDLRAQNLASCNPLLSIGLTSDITGVHFDSLHGVTEIFVGDPPNNRIVRHTVDANLNHTSTPLPIAYGVVWLAVDLDLDGNIELVVQRGDLGFGGDGYLDILSAPDWRLRQRFVMPGMKVEMNPVAVNIDSDPYIELYVTPEDLGGNGRAQIIKFNPATGGFDRIADIPSPQDTAGPSAVGDFDGDGRIEFITGHYVDTGGGLGEYGLFEYVGTSLVYIGPVGIPYKGNTNYAVAARPKPGGQLCALLGYSGLSFRYQLIEPTGDNTFSLVAEFTDSTGWSGAPICGAADMDCDGLDEIVVQFYPTANPVLKWDALRSMFDTICTFSHTDSRVFLHFYETDLNQNGIRELSTINDKNTFRAFESSCSVCTSPPSNLLAWWALDESFGTTAHDSWQNHDGLYVGTPLSTQGKVAGGLLFDSPWEGVLVGNQAGLDPGLGDFSMDAWVKTTSVALLNPILGKFDPATNLGWACWIGQGNRLALRLGDGASTDYSSGVVPIADGAWHHMALTVSRAGVDGVKFYLDGVLVGSANPTDRAGNISSTSPLWLGHVNPGASDSASFSGTLDEVRLFGRALTETEIRSIVAADSMGNCKPKMFSCDCRHQGDVKPDGVSDVFDIIDLIDYAFSGGDQPPKDDLVCPSIDRGDINCDGVDDVFDVVGLIDFTFSGGKAPCNPCACSSYPSNCPR